MTETENALSEDQRAYLYGQVVVEIGRQFVHPQSPEDALPMPWSPAYRAVPNTHPGSVNGQPTRWMKRTITYGPWEPVGGDV